MLGDPGNDLLDVGITEGDRLAGDRKETGWICWTEEAEVLRLLCEAAGRSRLLAGAGGGAPARHGGTRRHPVRGAPGGSPLQTGHSGVEISVSNLIF